MAAQTSANQHGIEEVVDSADDAASPDHEQRGLSPVAGETEVDGDGTPDEEGAKGGDHGHDRGGKSPEDDSGNSEDPESESGKDALDSCYGEPAESRSVNGVADPFEECVALLCAKG